MLAHRVGGGTPAIVHAHDGFPRRHHVLHDLVFVRGVVAGDELAFGEEIRGRSADVLGDPRELQIGGDVPPDDAHVGVEDRQAHGRLGRQSLQHRQLRLPAPQRLEVGRDHDGRSDAPVRERAERHGGAQGTSVPAAEVQDRVAGLVRLAEGGQPLPGGRCQQPGGRLTEHILGRVSEQVLGRGSPPGNAAFGVQYRDGGLGQVQRAVEVDVGRIRKTIHGTASLRAPSASRAARRTTTALAVATRSHWATADGFPGAPHRAIRSGPVPARTQYRPHGARPAGGAGRQGGTETWRCAITLRARGTRRPSAVATRCALPRCGTTMDERRTPVGRHSQSAGREGK